MIKILRALALLTVVAAGCGAPPSDVATTENAFVCQVYIPGTSRCIVWRHSLLTVASTCTAPGANCQVPYYSVPVQPRVCTSSTPYLTSSGGAKLFTGTNYTGDCMIIAPGYYPFLGEWAATSVDPSGQSHRIRSILTQTPSYQYNGGVWGNWTDNQSILPPANGNIPAWGPAEHGITGPSSLPDVTAWDIEALYLPQ